ncbi:hypothetical protein A8990_14255 [Paenibacillus taihuensis]|uniref:Uncharacterized protein n=1 Tax=Paenibacillus taihuensis TaxID=1156355 RepID=A0A3D9R1Q6_9BACL|nr:hypothetical protein [Paenibacillus taihuensis]REE67628.1 hypothetical protein A8990_14255 [Paenibacillus taihuensis]
MIWLILLYAAFLIAGFYILRAKNASRKEKTLFVVITTIGCVLWGSLLIRQPLDLNRAIAAAIDYLL